MSHNRGEIERRVPGTWKNTRSAHQRPTKALTGALACLSISHVSKKRPRDSVRQLSSAKVATRLVPSAASQWRNRVFKNFYTYRGRRFTAKRWSVKIQHGKIRRTFSLGANNRTAAAIEAQAIYQTIVTQGWDAVSPPGRLRGALLAPDSGAESESLPKTDIRYWKRRLLLRRHPSPTNPSLSAGLSARIEHAGINHYFPLGTLDEEVAATKAQEIYLAVVQEGWEAVVQRFPRELTVGIHWAENPLAWTYTSVHTLVEGPFPKALCDSTKQGQHFNVAILEPNAGVRRALVRCVNSQTGFACTATYSSAGDALSDIRRSAPDLALIDGSSPDVTAAEFSDKLQRLTPGLPIVFFTTHEDSDQLFKATPGGASGYLLKRTSPERLLEPIVGVLRDGDLSPDRIALHVRRYFQSLVESLSTLESARDMARLTQRERDILNLLSKGCLDKEIADALGISLWTVHGHLKKIYDKLDVHTRTEAAVRYLQK
jgi:DNA-binding NarL/FixJ family response regulator